MTSIRITPGLPNGVPFASPERSLYIAPAGIVAGDAAAAAVAAGQGWALGAGGLVFTACQVIWREGARIFRTYATFPDVVAWSERQEEAVAAHVAGCLQAMARPTSHFAGLSLDRPRLMGIVNVTPDSFSDGGRFATAEAAIAHGLALIEHGADLIDVGGESTRPGATPVPPEVEAARVLPVVRGLAEHGVLVSIDTRHASVMRAAVGAGARIINDVSALEGDPESLAAAADSGAHVILMHMQGEPSTMQAAPTYGWAPIDVYDVLAMRVEAAVAGGIGRDRVCIDPGIGFGKSVADNLNILQMLGLYQALGLPVLLGVSRKGFIAALSRGEAPLDRLPGSLAAGLAGLAQGVQMLRVHDVAETVQAIAVWRAAR